MFELLQLISYGLKEKLISEKQTATVAWYYLQGAYGKKFQECYFNDNNDFFMDVYSAGKKYGKRKIKNIESMEMALVILDSYDRHGWEIRFEGYPVYRGRILGHPKYNWLDPIGVAYYDKESMLSYWKVDPSTFDSRFENVYCVDLAIFRDYKKK